jgi:hypothetical protein
MGSAIGRYQQLRLLGDLCRELAKLGIRMSISDALPAVRVPVEGSKSALSVEVDGVAGVFAWADEHSHPVDDRAGAAAAIVAWVRSQELANVATPVTPGRHPEGGSSDACGD